MSDSNHRLLERLAELLRRDRSGEAELVEVLGEVDARRLYLERACSSMFEFCLLELRSGGWFGRGTEGAAVFSLEAENPVVRESASNFTTACRGHGAENIRSRISSCGAGLTTNMKHSWTSGQRRWVAIGESVPLAERAIRVDRSGRSGWTGFKSRGGLVVVFAPNSRPVASIESAFGCLCGALPWTGLSNYSVARPQLNSIHTDQRESFDASRDNGLALDDCAHR
jgi:hypothetical protein